MTVDALPFFPLTMNPQATAEGSTPAATSMRDRLVAATDAQWAAMQTGGVARLIKTEAARPAPIAAAVASDRAVVGRVVYELMTTDLRSELPAIAAPVTVVYAWDPTYGVPPEAIDATVKAAYAGTPRLALLGGAESASGELTSTALRGSGRASRHRSRGRGGCC